MSSEPLRRGRPARTLLILIVLAVTCPATSVPQAQAQAPAPAQALAWSYPQRLGPASLGGEASSFTGLNCPTAYLCLASNRDGSVLVTAHPRAGVSAWRPIPLASGARLVAISCPSAQLCLTAAEDGRVFVTKQPLGGAAAWTQESIPGLGLVTAAGCSASGTCAVVDDAGDVAATTAPLSGDWHVSQVDTATRPCGGARCQAGFTTVSCPSASMCAAFDQVGNVAVSTDATGGPESWQVQDVDYRGYGAAAPEPGCSGTFCVHLVCPSATRCVAVDSSGYVITSDDPSGPATSWIARPLKGLAGAPTALTCASPTVCRLADSADELLATTHPAGGAPAWSPVPFAPAGVSGDPYRLGIPQGTACPTSGECLAVDDTGNLVIGLVPASPAQVQGTARSVAAFAPLPGRRRLARTGSVSISFAAPQAGRLALTWKIRLTLPGRVAFTGRGKQRRRHVIPPRNAQITAAAQLLVLGPGRSEITVTLSRRARRLLSLASRGSLRATASFTSSSGRSGAVTVTRGLAG